MNLLASIYGTVVSARNALYDRKVFHGHRLQGPVISVGNLTVGGSGKTPFTILLGELLKARGIKFDILSRGYGRESRGVLLVDPAGSHQAFGDEPILISRKLQVPVVVGESRHEAGLFAERTFGPQLHLLDDGFQHRSLARDFDIVLLSSDDANGTLLPTGRLREPLSSLKRADAIVISDNHVPEMLPQLNKPIWKIQRGILVESPPDRPIVFCGIARPEGFFSQLRSAGIQPVGEARFRDHHRYSLREIRALGKLREEHKADGFITTEKDLINLREYRRDLEPVAVAKVTMELENPNNAVDTMLRIISTRAPGHEKILLTS